MEVAADTDGPPLTVGLFSKLAGISVETARVYGDLGFIECIRDSSGRRLFPLRAVQQARTVLASRTRKSAAE